MRSQINIWMLVLGCVSAPVFANSKVLKVGRDRINVAVTHDAGRTPWREQDRLCISQNGRPIVCGTVIRTSPKGAILRLEKATTEVAAGDIVTQTEPRRGGSDGTTAAPTAAAASPAKPVAANNLRGVRRRRPATALMGSANGSHEAPARFNISAGLSAGLSYFYPTIDFQVRVSKHFAIGVIPFYLRASADTTSLTAIGGFGTLNYYFDGYFRGFWVQGGGGFVSFSTTDSIDPTNPVTESVGVPAGIFTLGWRGYWDFGLNIGVAGGLQYIGSPTFTSTEVKSAGAQPLFLLDVGLNF